MSWHPDGLDSYQSWTYNLNNPYASEILKKNNWPAQYSMVVYKYNSHGFRGDEFPRQNNAIAMGCSHTFGLALPVEYSWVCKLSKMMGVDISNLGVNSGALDTVYRLSRFWIPILRPKYVFLLAPPSLRFEVSNDDVSWEIKNVHLVLDSFSKNYFSNGWNSDINTKKNLDAVRSICENYGAVLYVLSADHDLPADHGARDTFHSGPTAHEKVAEKFHTLFIKNEIYISNGDFWI